MQINDLIASRDGRVLPVTQRGKYTGFFIDFYQIFHQDHRVFKWMAVEMPINSRAVYKSIILFTHRFTILVAK